MSDLITCPQCGGRGCWWCNNSGKMTFDRYRECRVENRKVDDDRAWVRDRHRYTGENIG